MIQDIAPHKLYNEYRPENRLHEGSCILCLQEKSILAAQTDGTKEKTLAFPNMADLQYSGISSEQLVYVFSVDEQDFFLYTGSGRIESKGFSYCNILDVRDTADHVSGMIAFTASHLYQWYQENRFCGTCGGKTVHAKAERALVCSNCGRMIYPHIMPAVIVGVIHGDRILVTKYREGFRHYALIAGFVEIGETLEECVAREVMEETGLRVKNIRYYKSQPWGIVKDLLAGYYCEADGDTTIRMDTTELRVAEWKKREDVELQPGSYSLTNEMMKMFRDGRIAFDSAGKLVF